MPLTRVFFFIPAVGTWSKSNEKARDKEQEEDDERGRGGEKRRMRMRMRRSMQEVGWSVVAARRNRNRSKRPAGDIEIPIRSFLTGGPTREISVQSDLLLRCR